MSYLDADSEKHRFPWKEKEFHCFRVTSFKSCKKAFCVQPINYDTAPEGAATWMLHLALEGCYKAREERTLTRDGFFTLIMHLINQYTNCYSVS